MKKTTQNDAGLKNFDNQYGQFLFYSLDNGQTKIEVRLLDETVWLTQKQMTELFQKDVRTINEHISHIFEESELDQNSTIRKFRIVQFEGERKVEREVIHYNLDVIISVGYRVKSQRGTQFRIWATERLREYIIKGFTLDDERLKQGSMGSYFDELLSRIRDIRSSEKLFWKKVLDIYATSIDYDPKNDLSTEFFKVIQNKMHWAAHQHTAAITFVASKCGREPCQYCPSRGLWAQTCHACTGTGVPRHAITLQVEQVMPQQLGQLSVCQRLCSRK